MRFEKGDSSFKVIFVTDVSENGYWLEMYDCSPEGDEVIVITAFRAFGTRSVHVAMHVERLEFEVTKVFLDMVKINLVDLIEPPDPEEEPEGRSRV